MTTEVPQPPQPTAEQRIGERTQQLLAERIGMMVIGNARLQAEAEYLKAQVEAASPPPAPK